MSRRAYTADAKNHVPAPQIAQGSVRSIALPKYPPTVRDDKVGIKPMNLLVHVKAEATVRQRDDRITTTGLRGLSTHRRTRPTWRWLGRQVGERRSPLTAARPSTTRNPDPPLPPIPAIQPCRQAA